VCAGCGAHAQCIKRLATLSGVCGVCGSYDLAWIEMPAVDVEKDMRIEKETRSEPSVPAKA